MEHIHHPLSLESLQQITDGYEGASSSISSTAVNHYRMIAGAIATFELGPLDKRDLHWYLEHPPLANPGTEIVSLEEMSHPVMSMVWYTL